MDYSTAPGDRVYASAPGVVTFAGPVGGALHVVILHADGIRTSYSFLARAFVRRGQRIDGGVVIGTAGEKPLHFGARLGDDYIDPLGLLSLAPTRVRVRLLPDDGRGLPPEHKERSALARLLRLAGIATVPPWAVMWARGQVSDVVASLPPEVVDRVKAAVQRLVSTGDTGPLVSVLQRVLPDPSLAEVVAAALRMFALAEPSMVLAPNLSLALNLTAWQLTKGPCSAKSSPTPKVGHAAGKQRRLAVLVGGLGSTSEKAGIFRLKPERMGYLPEDVIRFSYRGGSTDTIPYGKADTQAALGESGGRLADLLDELARTRPGVPIDVFAHSQGGLVARAALTRYVEDSDDRKSDAATRSDFTADTEGRARAAAQAHARPNADAGPNGGARSNGDARPNSDARPSADGRSNASADARVTPPVEHLVTFGTPHHGADLAALVQGVKETAPGSIASWVGSQTRPMGLDPSRPNVGSLAPNSPFLRSVEAKGVPAGVKVTSIATRRDVVVPPPRSWLKGATNVIVPSHGINAHDELPESDEALREAALAVSGQPPTCEPLLDAVLDIATATAIQLGERVLTAPVQRRDPRAGRFMPYR